MEAARRLVHRHLGLASLLVALTLCVKLLVPTGFMPVMSGGMVTLQPCPDAGPVRIAVPATATATIHHGGGGHHGAGAEPVSDDAGDHESGHGEKAGEQAQAGMPCAFAGLAAPSLAAVDPVVLAIAVAAMLATLFRLPERVLARTAAHFRPPSRGPPASF